MDTVLDLEYCKQENTSGKGDFESELPLAEIYKLACNFYKEKEGKAVHFSYEDKLQLVAFMQQVLHGPLSEAISKLPPLGTLDVVGRDRRLAWQKLGKLSADQARAGFIELLSRKCPLFKAYTEAHWMEKKEQERLNREKEEKRKIEEAELVKKKEEERLVLEQKEKEEALKKHIQEVLNQHSYEQFKQYAEQQYPGEPEKQGVLIRQLQEQHYIQYMQEMQVNQKSVIDNSKIPDSKDVNENDRSHIQNSMITETIIEEPNMWTDRNIDSFKQIVSKAEGDNVVRVGHGETITVRVPAHHPGMKLFWEFATDYYDIGFGIFFEHGDPSAEKVSVHVSDSEDDDPDEDDLEDEDEIIHTGDLEAGSLARNGISKPLIIQIIPVFRRDCHTEVYAGCHTCPGKGVYLLKFDNSYSLWRSKTLYYRVYYSH